MAENVLVVYGDHSPTTVDDEDHYAFDPNAGLFGDWSWKPDRQPEDPGYVYDEVDLEFYELCRAFDGHCPARRPWMVRAYRGPEPRPPRPETRGEYAEAKKRRCQ